MVTDDQVLTDLVRVLTRLTNELVDTNTALAEIAQRVTLISVNAAVMVDEINEIHQVTRCILHEMPIRP